MKDIDISMKCDEKELKQVFFNDECDKIDYLIATGCGVIAGLIDIFLVGMPIDSRLSKMSDTQVDKTVVLFAKTCGWSPKKGKEKNIASAIGFLEKKFLVNYDQRHSGDVNGLFNMSTKNHHMKSLAHSPDIIGLFFSILNQFTSTSSFLHNGQMITIQTDFFELQGHDFISKLFCGIVNWFGHIMSDIAGSSGAVGRGSGIVIPFYELFQLCDFGKFQVGEYRNTFAIVATKVFQEGYDARFGLTMTIPVIICDLLVKLIWALKQFFYHKRSLAKCIPSKRHNDLRVMLLIGDGALCLMDGADAVIHSGGNCVNFFLKLNIIAWYRFAFLVLREVCIRLGISFPLQKQLDAYIRLNEELKLHLDQLKQTDIERFQRETEQCNHMLSMIKDINSEENLNSMLLNEYRVLGFCLPYDGDFDNFMNDDSSMMKFK